MSGLEGTASSAMTNDQIVFDAFNHHASAQRVETKQHVLNTLRKQYSEYHVTAVDAGQCSLLEFAAAGRATSTFEGQEELFHATREWKPVGTGVEKKTHPGRLQDDYSFARFSYGWDGCTFLVYHLNYQDPFQAKVRAFYILHPRSVSSSPEAHCAATDALILAASKWSSQLHQEIYVLIEQLI